MSALHPATSVPARPVASPSSVPAVAVAPLEVYPVSRSPNPPRFSATNHVWPYEPALATSTKKGKKRAVAPAQEGVGEERGGLHECDLVCGKMLSCGLHKCEERDHKGICPPCLRSSFEEITDMDPVCPLDNTYVPVHATHPRAVLKMNHAKP
ncbi:hypothetical protein C0992_008017 [Termitomyces sp. T32_za158]|nr:hypothetical protein C0992_008017 [Termitomyces sp. T32_za158]